MDREARVYQALDGLNIAYTKYEHAAASTMDSLIALSRDIGFMPNKNLFLCNAQGYYLLMIGADKKFRTAAVSPQVPTSRLSFGSEEKLFELLGLAGGSISPMGLINDTGKKVKLLIDSDLRSGKLCIHPCVNTASIVIDSADFYDIFLPHYGYVPQFVSVTDLL